MSHRDAAYALTMLGIALAEIVIVFLPALRTKQGRQKRTKGLSPRRKDTKS